MGNDPGFGIGKGGNLDGKLPKRERGWEGIPGAERSGSGLGLGINGNLLPTATDSKSEGYKTEK